MNAELAALSDLLKVIQENPEAARLAREKFPHLWEPVFEKAKELELVERAQHDTPDGKAAFYELVYGFKKPDHVQRECETIYAAEQEGMGSLIFAWRGSWKSVSNSVTDTAHDIGLHPTKTNLIVAANDDSAEKITKLIAEIIEFHPAWKKVFPNIIPDKGKWSVEGFWVMDNSISREEWEKRKAGKIDPTFVGGGYKSSRLNGKHPDGRLIIDDIHDRENSSSERERVAVVDILLKVILKTAVRMRDKLVTKIIAIGTPWAVDDGYHILRKSGEYKYAGIPAMVKAKEGEGVYCDGVGRNGVCYEDIVGWWHLTWPEGYGLQSVIADRATLGKAAFWQMIMLDLVTARSGGLRYYVFPHAEVEKTWPVQSGSDPAYTLKERYEEAKKNSSFALAHVAKRPVGGGVLIGGVLDKCTLIRAAKYIEAAQTLFVNHISTAIESVGMGQLFREAMRLINPHLILVSSDLGGIRPKGEKAGRAKSKHDRILYELAPHLESATILISDEDTQFLNAVRDGLDNFYELDETVSDERWDALDSFYHAVKAMPEVLVQSVRNQDISFAGLQRKQGLGSVWNAYGGSK